MATNQFTIPSVRKKISQDHLECPVCKSHYKHPKLLHCQHSFCFECLQKLTKGHSSKEQRISCPLCQEETTLSEDGVAGLRHDFKLSSMIDKVTLQEKLCVSQRSPVKCQACDEGAQAISKCMDCEHFLCQKCQQAHQRMAVMKSHQVYMYTLAQSQSDEVTLQSESVPKCATHSDQDLSLYCNTCQKLICVTCSIHIHYKPQHSSVDLKAAVAKCKEEVADLVAQVKQNRVKHTAVIREMEESCTNLDTMFTNTNRKISKRADAVVAMARAEEQNLAIEARNLYQDRVKTFQTALATNKKEDTQENQKLQEINRLMSRENQIEILQDKLRAIGSLKELAAKEPQKISSDLSFMDFEEGEKDLGRLIFAFKEPPMRSIRHQKELWARTGYVQSFGWGEQKKTICCAYDVAAFSDNEIVLADIEHKVLVAIFSDRKFDPKELRIKDLKDPRRIAVNKNDHLIVIDSQVIKIFNRKYEFLSKINPGWGVNNVLTCLAVDENNVIAVGYGKKKISLYTPTGSFIRSLPAPGIGDFLVTHTQQIIYWNGDKLQTMDYYGAAVSALSINGQPGETWYPTGICSDGAIGFFIAMRQSSSSGLGRINRFNPGDRQADRVIQHCTCPQGITITPAGELVVAAEGSLQIFHLSGQDST